MAWTGGLMVRFDMKVQGRPLLQLVTTGARTGKRRTTVLGWFADGDRDDSWLVVASNGGAAQHPGWAYNLVKHPAATAKVDGQEIPIRAELLGSEERQVVWDQVVELAPGYGAYVRKTDREIPIFRLERRTDPQ